MHWGMVIDLNRCTGCYACVLACKEEHSTPSGIFFRQVHFQEDGEYPSARRVHVPVQCNHCREPPCVPVCPTGATYKRSDGLVLVDADKCIGCAYCMEACPYEHRHFVEDKIEHFEAGLTPAEQAGGEAGHDWDILRGTVVKCTFCAHRLERAQETGLKPGIDRDVTPACVNTCPALAMEFGDLDDPESSISRILREREGFGLLEEAGTRPSIYYLQKD